MMVDELAEALLWELAQYVTAAGLDDFDARAYVCAVCNRMTASAGLAADLTAERACLGCGEPMQAISDVLVSPRPNRAERRARRPRR